MYRLRVLTPCMRTLCGLLAGIHTPL